MEDILDELDIIIQRLDDFRKDVLTDTEKNAIDNAIEHIHDAMLELEGLE